MFRPLLLAMLLATASANAASVCSGGQYEMSVEGVNGIFCVDGPKICIAMVSDGNCPRAQAGLPNGSFCGQVASGVFGCKTNKTPAPPVATTTAPPVATTTAPPVVTTPAPSKPPVPTANPTPATTTRCATGTEMSVEGVAGIFCIAPSQGPICIADRGNGACPGPQPGLPNGSSCGRVASGVFGCKVNGGAGNPPSSSPSSAPSSAPTSAPSGTTLVPVPAPLAGGNGRCGPGGFEMSVEGVPGIFCLTHGPICMAEGGTGTCPGPQTGLPNGSYCGRVASGVYGCKVGVALTTTTTAPSFAPLDIGDQTPPLATAAPVPVPTVTYPTPAATDGSQCPNGQFQMSVEGVRGVFCLDKGPICMATISTGTCPGPQTGLPNGSSCGRVASGVYGCKPNGGTGTAPSPVPSSAPATVPASTTLAPVPAPVETTSAPTTPLPASTPVTASPGGVCSNGATPMSIEGVPTIFCVNEPACAQQRSSGNCPGPQIGLPYGSRCDLISKTGVYGCKPNSAAGQEPVPVPAPAPVSVPTAAPVPVATSAAPAPNAPPAPTAPVTATPGGVCSNGGSPMSIEGVPVIFCVNEPACVQQRSTGNCPGPQIGLPYGSRCDLITKTGVYGCKPIGTQALRG